MADLGDCEHPQCEHKATHAVQLADMVRAVRCCEQHAGDFRECAAGGCGRLAQSVVTIGREQRTELWLCASCLGQFRDASSVTVDGKRFINDGVGWLMPIPRRVGRG